MVPFLRRHRLRLGRVLVSVLTLAWMTLALQPCASAEEHAATPVPAPATAHHAMAMDHGRMHMMDHAGMDHGDKVAAAAAEPCPPGADCPVFKAVADQAAAKAADPLDVPLQPAPALIASWRLPALPAVHHGFDVRTASVPIPPSPVLAFRILLI